VKYDYLCPCGQTTTLEIRLGEKKPEKSRCVCGKFAKRVLSVPGVHFSGEGWAGPHVR